MSKTSAVKHEQASRLNLADPHALLVRHGHALNECYAVFFIRRSTSSAIS